MVLERTDKGLSLVEVNMLLRLLVRVDTLVVVVKVSLALSSLLELLSRKVQMLEDLNSGVKLLELEVVMLEETGELKKSSWVFVEAF